MKKWNVVVHYEGACDYQVQANSEEEAKRLAEEMFSNEEDIEAIWSDVQWKICDLWEEK